MAQRNVKLVINLSPKPHFKTVRQLLPATDRLHLHKVQPSAPRLLVETHRLTENIDYGLTTLSAE